jgi:hypothetical protein
METHRFSAPLVCGLFSGLIFGRIKQEPMQKSTQHKIVATIAGTLEKNLKGK